MNQQQGLSCAATAHEQAIALPIEMRPAVLPVGRIHGLIAGQIHHRKRHHRIDIGRIIDAGDAEAE